MNDSEVINAVGIRSIKSIKISDESIEKRKMPFSELKHRYKLTISIATDIEM